MAAIKLKLCTVVLLLVFSDIAKGKLSENKTGSVHFPETKSVPKVNQDGPLLLLADELKITLEKYLFGICPPTFKSRWSQMLNKNKNFTTQATCDLDLDQQDLAGRLATLSLRAHAASRGECSRLGAALANTFGELARTAAAKYSAATNEANKNKRKLSKAQKLKIVANQRKALAVKKKAAAVAAATAAKATST